jgi:U3 small nucleolar RNA-associated protein 23
VRGDSCIIEVVGENNSEHFFVASQDTDLRKKLEEVGIFFVMLIATNR